MINCLTILPQSLLEIKEFSISGDKGANALSRIRIEGMKLRSVSETKEESLTDEAARNRAGKAACGCWY